MSIYGFVADTKNREPQKAFKLMKYMFWIDLEMTGLDVEKNRIIEVAVIVTNVHLEYVEKYQAVVRQPQAFLDQMDDWNVGTHGESGLTREVPRGKHPREVEGDLENLMVKYFPNKRVMLAGNSVGHDKLFLDAYMPKVAKLLHYRIIDISSMKAIFQSRYDVRFKRGENHRAMADIEESINELKLYLSFLDPSKINAFLDSED
mgnify:CR=1 FL=1